MSKTQARKSQAERCSTSDSSAAAQRPDGSLLPLPESLAAKGAALNRVMIEIPCKRKLAKERPTIKGAPEWRRNEDGRLLACSSRTRPARPCHRRDGKDHALTGYGKHHPPAQDGSRKAAPQSFEGISRQLQATSSAFAKQAGSGDPDAAAAIRRHASKTSSPKPGGSRIRCAASSAAS